jgi:NADH-quinone oxidoreductase subunit K
MENIGIAAAFACGLYTVLTRRDLVAIVAGGEVMLGAANVEVLRLAVGSADSAAASGLVLLVMVVAAAEAAVGLAIVVAAWRRGRRERIDEFGEVAG